MQLPERHGQPAIRPPRFRVVIHRNQQPHQNIQRQHDHGDQADGAGYVDSRNGIHNYGMGADFTALRNCAIAASTSSSLEGTPCESTFGWPSVISTSSSMRTPMPLYFSNAGRTAAMNFSFSGVLGRLSSTSGRM